MTLSCEHIDRSNYCRSHSYLGSSWILTPSFASLSLPWSPTKIDLPSIRIRTSYLCKHPQVVEIRSKSRSRSMSSSYSWPEIEGNRYSAFILRAKSRCWCSSTKTQCRRSFSSSTSSRKERPIQEYSYEGFCSVYEARRRRAEQRIFVGYQGRYSSQPFKQTRPHCYIISGWWYFCCEEPSREDVPTFLGSP